MKTHAIIPIFIPHRGCGHSCVFCNQRAITARQADVTPDDVRGILDTWLSTTQALETVEAAFYGGSFTGLPMEEQASFLAVLKEYKDQGRIDKIHLSTRPDYINVPILDQLKKYGADTIELGVQSFDPDVLAASKRGHSVEDVFRACDLIKSYEFELGIQLMIGLPGDSYDKCIASARKTVEIGPALARLYPTIVLNGTELARMYEAGTYHALTTEEAVSITKDMYRILNDAGITILRVGLKSTDLISDDSEDSQVLGHSYHPAIRQLIEGELAKEDLETGLRELRTASKKPETNPLAPRTTSKEPVIDPYDTPSEDRTCSDDRTCYIFSCCGASYSNMIGHKACNKKYFSEKYPSLSFRFTVDDTLPRGTYQVRKAWPYF